MKSLEQLLKDIKGLILERINVSETQISTIEFDSRKVSQGALFVATAGVNSDGHAYISKAIEQGAAAIVCEHLPEELVPNVPYIKVNDSHEALGQLASAIYDHPSRALQLVGITGTNGKTSTATLLYDLFRGLGYRVGLLSTVAYYIDDQRFESTHTTPDAVRINALMREMVDAGCDYCFMEVSSHALVQRRVAGLRFVGAMFSNITRDHLDYHHTFAEYITAKRMLFDMLDKEAFALTNIDDRNGRIMVQNCSAKVSTYSLRSMADFRCKVIEMHLDGMLLKMDDRELWARFVGRFNAYNLLAVYSAAVLLGTDKEAVMEQMSLLLPVSGRFENINSEHGTTVIIDYAHTPDALESVCQTIEQVRCPSQQLFVVCGCGGDRDRGKRPQMARIAVQYATTAIFTSDNPRHEDPEAIIDEMVEGLEPAARYLRITDRETAIRSAIMLCQKGDIILLAGKGHETYQIIGDQRINFSDKEHAMQELKNFDK